MKEYEITGNVGDEVVIKKGDLNLVVKIGENELIPDFATAVTNALLAHPSVYLNVLESVWHNKPTSQSKLRETVAWSRDKAFANVSVKQESKQEETVTVESSKKAKK